MFNRFPQEHQRTHATHITHTYAHINIKPTWNASVNMCIRTILQSNEKPTIMWYTLFRVFCPMKLRSFANFLAAAPVAPSCTWCHFMVYSSVFRFLSVGIRFNYSDINVSVLFIPVLLYEIHFTTYLAPNLHLTKSLLPSFFSPLVKTSQQ